jgi:lysozyme family protein
MSVNRQRFDRLIPAILKHEGGLADDPADPGGITKYGISLRAYPALGAEGIRNLTLKQACDLYYCDYWLRLRLGEIANDAIAQKLLDTAINIGQGTAAKLLQKSLCDIGIPVKVDGLMGPKTIDATNRADPEKLMAILKARLIEQYQALIKRNPALDKYRRGWLRRAMWGGDVA